MNLMCVMRAVLSTLAAALLLTPASADAHHYHGRNAGGGCLNVYRGDGVLGKPIPNACNTNFYGGDGDDTEYGGTAFNLYVGGGGSDTLNSPPGAVNRFVFRRMEDSFFQTRDIINGFSLATDVIDVSKICKYEYQITCSGPYYEQTLLDHGTDPGAIYYTYIPNGALGGYYTAVFAYFTQGRVQDFYFPINARGPNGDGKLPLTADNFDFGN
jgi:hypothetical protein